MTKGLRDALEAALRENPDDLAAHMAWADHLAEQGDPRGEFAQVQIALEDPSRTHEQRKELEGREADLLRAHRDEWLGPMAVLFDRMGYDDGGQKFGIESVRYDDYQYRFARGWLDTLQLGWVSPELIAAVAACPTAGRLRELVVHRDDYENPGLDDLPGLPFLGSLRAFRLGDASDQCRVTGEGIGPAIEKMTRLEQLELYTSESELGHVFAIPLPRLRTLVAHHQDDYPLDVLGDNPTMTNLITLDCFPHALLPEDVVAYLRSEPFIAMVRSPHLRSLTHLTLYCHEIGDAGIEALVASGMLRRLQTLDLWSGNISDVGARALVASGQLGGLRKLRLSENYLTDDGIAALRATGVPLEAVAMFNPANLGGQDREHLWNGDME